MDGPGRGHVPKQQYLVKQYCCDRTISQTDLLHDCGSRYGHWLSRGEMNSPSSSRRHGNRPAPPPAAPHITNVYIDIHVHGARYWSRLRSILLPFYSLDGLGDLLVRSGFCSWWSFWSCNRPRNFWAQESQNGYRMTPCQKFRFVRWHLVGKRQ